MLSLLEGFELSQTPMPPFLCPPSSHFLDHLCPTSLSPFLISFQKHTLTHLQIQPSFTSLPLAIWVRGPPWHS